MKKIPLFFFVALVSLICIAGYSQYKKPSNINTVTTATTLTRTNGIISKKVTIANFQFSPASIEIIKWGIVSRTNNDATTHVILSDNNAFQSAPLQKGNSFSFKFIKTGTYTYHCKIHPSMKGTILVK